MSFDPQAIGQSKETLARPGEQELTQKRSAHQGK
jgi:hypothetical protein